MPYLSRLTGLRNLLIKIPTVTDATLAQFSRLTLLEELAFGGDKGSDAGMGHLKALTNLETLQVYGPWFTDAGLAAVSEMEHLPNFFVSDETSVTGDGLYDLQQRRPALRIGVNGSGRVARARLDLLRRSVGRGCSNRVASWVPGVMVRSVDPSGAGGAVLLEELASCDGLLEGPAHFGVDL